MFKRLSVVSLATLLVISGTKVPSQALTVSTTTSKQCIVTLTPAERDSLGADHLVSDPISPEEAFEVVDHYPMIIAEFEEKMHSHPVRSREYRLAKQGRDTWTEFNEGMKACSEGRTYDSGRIKNVAGASPKVAHQSSSMGSYVLAVGVLAAVGAVLAAVSPQLGTLFSHQVRGKFPR